MRNPLQEFQGDTYERPNQPWVCGLADEGATCSAGPGKGGQCPGASACHPVREGDRWICNQSPERGGPCENGPTPEGECCRVFQCTPLRSLRASRGRFVFGCFLVTLGGLCLMLSANWRNEALAPGPLSSHHAQLLERGVMTDRCAVCHAAGQQSVGQWMLHAVNNDLAQPSQTSLCMECHKSTLNAEKATWAHNMEPQVLLTNSDTAARRRLDPTQELACSTCHQEHHGADHDLTRMTDNACQACHQQQYHSFATDHPEFASWPTSRRTRIAFDHGAHQLKYFPKENQQFDCAMCHSTGRDGRFQQTLSYEATCAKCHDSKIETSSSEGIAMFSLPMLDGDSLRDAQHDIGQWPKQALGDFDGALPPITKLLLAADPQTASALATLGVDFDFFDVEPDDPQQLQAAAELIWAMKRLLHEVTTQGQSALRLRVETLLGRKLTKQEFAALSARLSPDNLAAMNERWLTALPSELASGQKASAPVGNLSAPNRERSAEQTRIAAGGWLSDDTTLSVRYLPVGHADPWLTAWIDTLAEATTGLHAEVAKPLLKEMMNPTAAGQCGSCHSLDRLDSDQHVVHWFAKRVEDQPPSFTVFSHGPHLTQAQLSDCSGCHKINPLAKVMASYAEQSPHEYENGFQSITKTSCAECHTRAAAGDSCTQCHNYHVHVP